MPIQAVTPRVTPRVATQKVQTQALNPLGTPVKKQAPQVKKQEFNWLPDIFKSEVSKQMDEVKAIKNNQGFQRYDKEDQKKIKKYLKKGELDVDTVKTFAQTNLTVKGMSEAYEFSKTTKNPKAEQQNILKAVVEFEKPEMKMPQQYKEYRTRLERNKNSTYKIENHNGLHNAIYKAGGQKLSESTVEAGPYYPSPRKSSSSSESNSTSSTTNNRDDDWSNPLNPMSPISPLNPMNW